MVQYGLFSDSFVFGGISYRVEEIQEPYPSRAGFERIIAVDGVPNILEEDLVRSAQVCKVPHTWCVRSVSSTSEVSEEDVIFGKEILRRDRVEFGSRIFTYVGLNAEAPQFLAAGALRDKLTRDFQNPLYPVVSRAVVHPDYRGRGLGSLIVEHRMKAALCYFGQEPRAIHFATESPEILHAVRRFELETGLVFLFIGQEQYRTEAGWFSVDDYLCVLPSFRAALLAEAEQSKVLLSESFCERFALFLEKGSRVVSGDALAVELEKYARGSTKLELLQELFTIRKTIGSKDPSVPS